MALSAATLGTELQAMAPAPDEATGIDNFAAAFENYFSGATCGGASVTGGTLAPCTVALKAAMVGVSATGPASIAAGIVAFWSIVATTAAVIWVLVPPLVAATPPPGLGGLAAAIAATGTANIAGELSLIDAANAMGTAIHPFNLGGLGTIVTPPGGTLPIL